MDSFAIVTESGNKAMLCVCKCGSDKLRFEREPVNESGSAGYYVWIRCKDCGNKSEKAIQGMSLHEELAISNWNGEQKRE